MDEDDSHCVPCWYWCNKLKTTNSWNWHEQCKSHLLALQHWESEGCPGPDEEFFAAGGESALGELAVLREAVHGRGDGRASPPPEQRLLHAAPPPPSSTPPIGPPEEPPGPPRDWTSQAAPPRDWPAPPPPVMLDNFYRETPAPAQLRPADCAHGSIDVASEDGTTSARLGTGDLGPKARQCGTSDFQSVEQHIVAQAMNDGWGMRDSPRLCAQMAEPHWTGVWLEKSKTWISIHCYGCGRTRTWYKSTPGDIELFRAAVLGAP